MTTSTKTAWFIQPHYNVLYEDGKVTIFSSSAWKKGKEMIQGISNKGYWRIRIAKKTQHIHDIVTEYFLGKKPVGMTVNHKDGNKSNNSIGNLEYLSPSDNQRHAIATGLKRARRGIESHAYKHGRSGQADYKRTYSLAYRLSNRDKLLAQKKAFYYANKDKNKDKNIAYSKAYRLANRDKILIKRKARYLAKKNKTTTTFTTNE